jgi:hypothetical protein
VRRCISALARASVDVVASANSAEICKRWTIFDGILCSIFSQAWFQDGEYIDVVHAFLSQLGNRVVSGVLLRDQSLMKFRKFNMISTLTESLHNWRSLIGQGNFCMIESDPGWRSAERMLGKMGLPTPPTPCGPFEFRKVLMRVPLGQPHVSYFRYTISTKLFAKSITACIQEQNMLSASIGSANESNTTLVDTDHLLSRKGSCVSSSTGSPPCLDTIAIFESLCLNFCVSFGSGFLSQISNEVISSFLSPPSDFLRLVLAMNPSLASPESQASVRSFLVAILIRSVRALVNSSQHRHSEEGACLAFLMSSELQIRRSPTECIVFTALVESALRFAVNELYMQINSIKESLVDKFVMKRTELSQSRQIVDWLEWFVENPQVNAFTPNRSELRSIYRECSTGSEVALDKWETKFAKSANQCNRLIQMDTDILLATARGMGIVAMAAGEEKSPLRLPLGRPKSPPSPVLLDELAKEIQSVKKQDDNLVLQISRLRAEMNERKENLPTSSEVSKLTDQVGTLVKNQETLFLELSRMKINMACPSRDDTPMLPDGSKFDVPPLPEDGILE